MSELNDLILPLHKETMRGKVTWTLEGRDRISTLQGDNLIEILDESSYKINFEHTYNLTIRNKDGIVLDSNVFNEEELIYFSHLKEIYQKVKRAALRTDETLEDIKRRLLSL